MDIVDVIHVADGVEWSGRRLGWCCWKLRRQRQTCQKKTDATNPPGRSRVDCVSLAAHAQMRGDGSRSDAIWRDWAWSLKQGTSLARAFVWPDAAHEALPRAVGLAVVKTHPRAATAASDISRP